MRLFALAVTSRFSLSLVRHRVHPNKCVALRVGPFLNSGLMQLDDFARIAGVPRGACADDQGKFRTVFKLLTSGNSRQPSFRCAVGRLTYLDELLRLQSYRAA